MRKDFVRERVMIWLPSPTVCADPEDEAPPTDTAANGVAAEDAAEADGKVAEGRTTTLPERALFNASLSERLGPGAAPPETPPTAGAPEAAATPPDAPACDNARQTRSARGRLFRGKQA